MDHPRHYPNYPIIPFFSYCAARIGSPYFYCWRKGSGKNIRESLSEPISKKISSIPDNRLSRGVEGERLYVLSVEHEGIKISSYFWFFI